MKKTLLLFILTSQFSAIFCQYCDKSLPDADAVDPNITRFRLSGIDNASGVGSYRDFTSLVANLEQNTSVTAIVNNTGSQTQNGRIYIDWNHDFDFLDPDETIIFTTSASGETTVNIDVPADALLGNTRLRVIVAWNGNPSGTSACNPSGSTGFRIGEVEDYSVSVGNVLPIALVNFMIQSIKKSQVLVSWETDTELNNDFFTIERSKNAIEWETIGTEQGAGNSSTLLRYSFLDINPFSGRSYYRLKQTDFNGQFEYFSIEFIDLPKYRNVLELYPNPVTTHVFLKADRLTLEDIRVYSLDGQNLTAMVSMTLESESLSKLDFSKLYSGIYYVKTENKLIKVLKQ